jgi:hypothetical protein
MVKLKNHDLFAEPATMPFGEHLEELRSRLWKTQRLTPRHRRGRLRRPSTGHRRRPVRRGATS